MERAKTRMLRAFGLRRRDGFTLIEIIVALTIVGILSAIAIPNWSTLLPTHALNGAARQVQSELHRLKSRAVSENAAFRLVFSTSTSSYTVEKYSGGSWTATGENKLKSIAVAVGRRQVRISPYQRGLLLRARVTRRWALLPGALPVILAIGR